MGDEKEATAQLNAKRPFAREEPSAASYSLDRCFIPKLSRVSRLPGSEAAIVIGKSFHFADDASQTHSVPGCSSKVVEHSHAAIRRVTWSPCTDSRRSSYGKAEAEILVVRKTHLPPGIPGSPCK